MLSDLLNLSALTLVYRTVEILDFKLYFFKTFLQGHKRLYTYLQRYKKIIYIQENDKLVIAEQTRFKNIQD